MFLGLFDSVRSGFALRQLEAKMVYISNHLVCRFVTASIPLRLKFLLSLLARFILETDHASVQTLRSSVEKDHPSSMNTGRTMR